MWWWGRGSELRGPKAAAQESQTGFNSFDIPGGMQTDGGGNRRGQWRISHFMATIAVRACLNYKYESGKITGQIYLSIGVSVSAL
jgi:hypothetical protein